jgi:hypothetical protein
MFLLGLWVIALYVWHATEESEVVLRNKIIGQKQFVSLIDDSFKVYPQDKELRESLLLERKRLIDYEREYATMREVWVGRLILGSTPILDGKSCPEK